MRTPRLLHLLFAISLLLASCSPPGVDDIEGAWFGTYICSQAITNLSLLITKTATNKMEEIFELLQRSDNPGVPTGSFHMRGSFNADNRSVSFVGTDWIEQPQGFVTLDLIGTLPPNKKSILGKVVGPNFTTFSVDKE